MNRYDRHSGAGAGGRPEDGGMYAKYGGGGRASAGGAARGLDVEEELNRRGDPNERPNKILLFTVLNATYPVDVATMYRVCSPHGRVLRIVMFRKEQNLHAMVEFADLETAIQAKWNLHGKSYYRTVYPGIMFEKLLP
jgi:hypothetical protein